MLGTGIEPKTTLPKCRGLVSRQCWTYRIVRYLYLSRKNRRCTSVSNVPIIPSEYLVNYIHTPTVVVLVLVTLSRSSKGYKRAMNQETYQNIILQATYFDPKRKPKAKSEAAASSCSVDELVLLWKSTWNLATPACNVPLPQLSVVLDKHYIRCTRRSAIAHELTVVFIIIFASKPR